MIKTDGLRKYIEQYRLDIDGVRFWTPYWVNDQKLMAAVVKQWIEGPYRGKGTPQQIQKALTDSLQQRPTESAPSAEVYRQRMREIGLGIDCSGFVYYVLDQALQEASKRRLAELLSIPRAAVLEAYDAKESWREGVSRQEVEKQPDDISASWIEKNLKKQPAQIINVARLVQPQAVKRVMSASEAQPGDMIKMTSDEFGDHIALVVENNGSEIATAESLEPEADLGGVTYNKVMITNPAKDLQYQQWSSPRSYRPASGRNDGIWRLKELSDLV